jgi:hypothetical protein
MNDRHLTAFAATFLRHFTCVTVVSARRSGKTTLLGMLPGAWRRFDMESTADRCRRPRSKFRSSRNQCGDRKLPMRAITGVAA